jgi:hypothetical protein
MGIVVREICHQHLNDPTMQMFEVCLKGGKDLSLIMVENEVQLDIQLL